jgi:hypothetical protein
VIPLGVVVGDGVTVGVGVGVAVGVGVIVGVGVGVGDPHGWYRATSSTYIPVRWPKPSSCTRNLMRTVCPAYGRHVHRLVDPGLRIVTLMEDRLQNGARAIRNVSILSVELNGGFGAVPVPETQRASTSRYP